MLGTSSAAALQQLNPKVPTEALGEAFRKLTRPDSPSLVANNHTIHKYLVDGVPVEYQRQDGSIGGDLVRVLDYDTARKQRVSRGQPVHGCRGSHERRPDVVLFVNGLPLAVIELKNAATESATIWTAFNQLQTYKQQIPSLFAFNEALVISDGVQARIGTLTADREWFMPWRTIEGEELADTQLPQLQVVLEGVFEKRRFLDLIRHFIVFEDAAAVSGQEDGGVPPVSRGECGAANIDASTSPDRWTYEQGTQAGRRRRRDLAHPGVGQEPDDGILRRASGAAPGDGKPDTGRHHRPQRPRRPTLRHLRTVP